MMTIFGGALKYILSTLLNMNIIRVSLALKWHQTMKFSRTQSYFRLKDNCISLFSTTILGLQVVKIVQGLQTFNPHFTGMWTHISGNWNRGSSECSMYIYLVDCTIFLQKQYGLFIKHKVRL
jgi:hypothetical protein